MPRHVDMDGDLILDWDRKKGGRSDFEIGERSGNGSGDVVGGAADGLLKGNMTVMRGIACKLHFQIAAQCGLLKICLRQMKTNADDGKLRAPGGLKHVEIAIGIARVS